MQNHRQVSPTVSADSLAIVLEHVRSALQGLRFGHVTLIVQDGKVVQVDRFEKTRISAS
ncbi:MAG: hypothetical protein JWP89_4720 [Schlesneria sp.]|nr:hypothetical protein [Schlesneria sp.]